jgi:putative zinc finger protein
MNHQEATELVAVEKYLLDELSPPLRNAFEEHYFDCPECAADLRATAAFLDTAKRQLSSVSVVKPARGTVRNSWFAFLGKPAFLSPAFASLLLIIGYQNFVVFPRSSVAIAGAKNPEIMPSLSLVGGNSRGAAMPTIAVENARSFLMSVDIPANERFSSYVCVLKSASGSTLWTLPIPAQLAKDTVSIRVPVTKGLGGSYTLVVQGLNSSAPREPAVELAQYRFKLIAL